MIFFIQKKTHEVPTELQPAIFPLSKHAIRFHEIPADVISYNRAFIVDWSLSGIYTCACSHIVTVQIPEPLGGGGVKKYFIFIISELKSIILRYLHVKWRQYVSLFQYRKLERDWPWASITHRAPPPHNSIKWVS